MNKISPAIIEQFKNIVGEPYLFTDRESIEKYGKDETENLFYAPEVIAKPRTAQEISDLLKICNQHLIPVTPRGGGTGLTGGALPHFGGLVISMERFNDSDSVSVIRECRHVFSTQELQQWFRSNCRRHW